MEKPDIQKIHRYFASDCFNKCWGFVDKEKRTEKENEEMRRLSEVSCWHWMQVTDHTQENLSISYWQLARVYAISDKGEEALRYAEICVEISESASLEPFYIGYAYEAVARAHIVLGNEKQSLKAKTKATALASQIDDKESKVILLADLKGI
ncbi:MAG: hypothetical protein H8D05_01325 [FCB group bacterium]|nr:hypothetical protein [FCB group bacterium]